MAQTAPNNVRNVRAGAGSPTGGQIISTLVQCLRYGLRLHVDLRRLVKSKESKLLLQTEFKLVKDAHVVLLVLRVGSPGLYQVYCLPTT